MITWAGAHQGPLSVGFSRQEFWTGLPCPPLKDLPNPGTERRSSALRVDSLPSEPPGELIVCSSEKSRFAKLSQVIGKRGLLRNVFDGAIWWTHPESAICSCN